MARSARQQSRGRRRLPLSARLTFLVLFAAIVPLAAVVGINDTFARSTLEQQGRTSLTTDAQSKAALVQEYLQERLFDSQASNALAPGAALFLCTEFPSFPAAQAAALAPLYSLLNCAQQGAFYEAENCHDLYLGRQRDQNYVAWTDFSVRGTAIATGDASLTAQQTHCPAQNIPAMPQEVLQQLLQSPSSWISPVYTDATKQNAFIDFYTAVTLTSLTNKPSQVVIGIVRSTLNMRFIYTVLSGEQGANGAGSYAFITDALGIRIADTHASELFSAIQPLDAATQQQISTDKRFGDSTQIQQDSLPAVAASLHSARNPDQFQSSAVSGDSTPYQFARVRIQLFDALKNAPLQLGWSYFVLSPISTVTAVANDQIQTSLIIAAIIAVLAILLGLFFGQRIANPVHAATTELGGAAATLKALATRQESSASEQEWVVDACKTGLDGVRYLSDAMNQAARRVIDASNWFSEYWDRLNEEQARRTVQHLLELARYIDEAARRQQINNERLSKAITVTDQVSAQLVAGATAATQSAEQLEQVVSNLQRVVGGRPRAIPVGESEWMNQQEPDGMLALPAPAAQRNGNAGMPGAPSAAYAPRAPQSPWNAGQPSQPFDSNYDYNDYNSHQGPPSSWQEERPGAPANRQRQNTQNGW